MEPAIQAASLKYSVNWTRCNEQQPPNQKGSTLSDAKPLRSCHPPLPCKRRLQSSEAGERYARGVNGRCSGSNCLVIEAIPRVRQTLGFGRTPMRDAPKSRQWGQPREVPSLLRFAGFVLDLDACTLVRETGEVLALTRGEFALLRVFVTRPGRVLSRDTLLEALASRRFEPFDRSVDVMVGKLRRKIEPEFETAAAHRNCAGRGLSLRRSGEEPRAGARDGGFVVRERRVAP